MTTDEQEVWEVVQADDQVVLTFGRQLGARLVPTFLTAMPPDVARALADALVDFAEQIDP